MTHTDQLKPARRVDLEIMRIVAIFCIVFNHTQLRGFELYTLPGGAVNVYGSLFLAVLCRIGVPLFLMISGGLLLGRTEPLKVVVQKRVLRILLALVVFTIVSYVHGILTGWIQEPGIKDFFVKLWSTGVTIPYWYLYLFLALMLMLPLLRPMAQNMGDQLFQYLIVLHLAFFCFVPLIGFLFKIGPMHSDFDIPLIGRGLFFFLLGYYVLKRFDWSCCTRKWLLLSWAAAVVAVAANMALILLDLHRNGGRTFYLMDSFVIFPTWAVYATAHQLCMWRPMGRTAAKVIGVLGSCTFGTYLLEGIFRSVLLPVYNGLEGKIHVLPACLVWVFCVVAMGLAVTWVLKHIPGLRKLL